MKNRKTKLIVLFLAAIIACVGAGCTDNTAKTESSSASVTSSAAASEDESKSEASEEGDTQSKTESEADVSIDLGSSEIYNKDELKDAVIQIKCKFASLAGCELKSIRYAGDEAANEENLKRMNDIDDSAGYTQVAEFVMDFHTPENPEGLTLEADRDYTDYQWWLARTADGGWDIVSFGY